jgi:hypothetical protein
MQTVFKTTSANGFHITFANGVTVSVQWNPGNYVADRSGEQDVRRESVNAEVAVWRANGEWVRLDEYGDVIGWQTPEQVLAIMSMAAAL